MITKFILSLLVLVALSTTAYNQSTDIEMLVDDYLKPYLDTRNLSGSVLIARDGQILLSKGYGIANLEHFAANTPQTKFHIASVSKPFTAAAIMILEERGLLSVHDPLMKFIADYPDGEKITIHHLLTHTSGIPNINNFPDYDEKSKFPQSTESLVGMFKEKPLEFEPGKKYSYSNSNYNLLAYIIELVSGKRFGEVLQENIFLPLEMNNTGHHGDASLILEHNAEGYVPEGVTNLVKAPFLNWTIKTGNGSLYSTTEDLYKWVRALFTQKILSKTSLNNIFTNYVDGVGYGWFIRNRFNREVRYINGRSPGFNSYLGHFVKDDVCIVVLSNIYNALSTTIGEDLAAIVLGEKYKIPELKSIRPDPALVNMLIGEYQFEADFYQPNFKMKIYDKEGHLFSSWGALLSISETEFIDRAYWGKMIFEREKNGNIAYLIYNSFRGKKIMK